MTIDDITSKLFAVLNRNPIDEQDVVYAFVKIRKMLEHARQKQQYALLNLFCNWLLHVELENPTVGDILAALDREFQGFDRARPWTFDQNGIVSDIISLQIFRNELLDFLRANDLPTVWVEDLFAWTDLLRFYGEEVRDTPLLLKADMHSLVFIAQVVITACEPTEAIVKSNMQYEHTGLKWEFTLKDGKKFVRTYTINVPQTPPGWRTMGTK